MTDNLNKYNYRAMLKEILVKQLFVIMLIFVCIAGCNPTTSVKNLDQPSQGRMASKETASESANYAIHSRNEAFAGQQTRFDGKNIAPREKKATANNSTMPEYDPVRPIEKNQFGFEMDPHLIRTAHYDPTYLALVQSQAEPGVTQQTFAQAGGDMQVDLNRDGTQMLFSTIRYSRNPKIAMQSTRGKTVTLITDTADSAMMPRFSPDGKKVAWCSDREGDWNIYVKDIGSASSAQAEQVARSKDDEIHPAWSPDGKLIIYSRFNSMDGVWQVWVVDLATRMMSNITEGLFPVFSPVIASDGTYTIAFQRHRKRDLPWYSIWTLDFRMRQDGRPETIGAPRDVISSDDWAAITPTFSPDGRYIAFATVRKSRLAQWQARIYKPDDIWAVSLDGTDLTQITTHPAPDWNPCWASEEGNPYGRIYFTSERNGVPNIWSVQPQIPGMIVDKTMPGMR